MQLISSRPHIMALSVALALSACGGSSDEPLVIPAAPADQGAAEVVPLPTVTAFVDTIATNQRGDARYATLSTNAGVRVLGGFLDIWKPLTEIVDAGVTAPARDGFPAVVASSWSGVPNDGNPDGKVVNAAVHQANIDYVVKATTSRTAEQGVQAYLDDRRGKGYSVADGMGPLANAWRTAAQQTTSITSVAADATTVLYNDSGNNTGVAGSANASFGSVVDLVNLVGSNASTEPAKRFYKYARPYRWSSSVLVLPALVPAKSSTPATDGGFTSGHSAEGVRDAVAMAYAVPERFQEMLSRGLELGESRIMAGMHSPLDVISGRILGQASAAANLADPANATRKAAAVAQAHATLMAATGTNADTFAAYAQSGTTTNDRFADYATNKANYLRRSTYGFAPIAATNVAAAVPKGAEVLLETRLPYLSDAQRRVVLKTTALPSGYPVMDDAEGWGRLNLFAAADGYASFSGNVTIVMDASKGGFNAVDRWRNDIGGTGKLEARLRHAETGRRQYLVRRHRTDCGDAARRFRCRLRLGRCLRQRRHVGRQCPCRAEGGRQVHPIERQHHAGTGSRRSRCRQPGGRFDRDHCRRHAASEIRQRLQTESGRCADAHYCGQPEWKVHHRYSGWLPQRHAKLQCHDVDADYRQLTRLAWTA